MAKFTLSLKVVVLAVLVDVVLSSFAAGGWSRLGGGRPGFGKIGSEDGKCSAMRSIPDPKSGCCGRHADGDQGGNNDGSDGGDQEDNTDNDNQVDGYNPTYPDYGPDDTGVIFSPDDLWGALGGNGIDDIDVGDFDIGDSDFGKIFDGGDLWSFNEENRYKRSADKNASDIPPAKYIMAGRPAGLAQYPWLVHLLVTGEDETIGCGGSLVSSRYVITAAHCLDHNIRRYEDVNVFLAEYNTRTFPTDCVGTQCIENLVMHPDKISIHSGYQRGDIYNDLGMMRLRGSAPYSDYIRPICLPSFNINIPRNDGTPLTITGWGRTKNGKPSSVKLHTEVQLVASTTCRRYYPHLIEGQLCAAGRSGQDTCMGDSGGPIMAEHEGNFYLVGLVSGKRADADCGSPVPTIYTNVFTYMKWIQDFMRN